MDMTWNIDEAFRGAMWLLWIVLMIGGLLWPKLDPPRHKRKI